MKKELFIKLASRHKGSSTLIDVVVKFCFSDKELDLIYSHIKSQSPYLKKYAYLLKR